MVTRVSSLLSRMPGMESFSWLARDLPGFPVHGSQVRIIREPGTFYQELVDRVSSSKRRVVLSSLYLGTGDKERRLVEEVRESLIRNPTLRARVLLDWCRGTREVQGQSSCTLLAPLAGEDRCQVAMYHTPRLRGALKWFLPPRWNEVVGLQHCKVYVFDNSVIVSGANLSKDYFTARQDRYLLVEDCKELADYYEDLVTTVSSFSLQMDSEKLFETSQNLASHPFRGKLADFVSESSGLMRRFLERQKTRNCSDINVALTDQIVMTKEISDSDKSDVTNVDIESEVSGDRTSEYDTVIFPTVQMGQLGIRQDSQVTLDLLKSGEKGSTFNFGTGYFNLTKEYLDQVVKGTPNYQILMAHPKANGFYNDRGVGGGIPHAYTLIARRFWELLARTGQGDRVRMFEYQRPGWTFHAKGLWYTPPGAANPALTLVGSPNFGYRSVDKDLESQVAVVTSNPDLQSRLGEEQRGLFELAEEVTGNTYSEQERQVPVWVRGVVGLARRFF